MISFTQHGFYRFDVEPIWYTQGNSFYSFNIIFLKATQYYTFCHKRYKFINFNKKLSMLQCWSCDINFVENIRLCDGIESGGNVCEKVGQAERKEIVVITIIWAQPHRYWSHLAIIEVIVGSVFWWYILNIMIIYSVRNT